MTLKKNDEIFKLRRETQKLMRRAEEQALDAHATAAEAASFDRLAIELYDLDSTLYEAPFINNDSAIAKLIDEIKAATAGAQKLQFELGELKSAIKDARKEIQGKTARLPKAKAILDEAQGFIDLLS
jgi:chromosome segregation ATPase